MPVKTVRRHPTPIEPAIDIPGLATALSLGYTAARKLVISGEMPARKVGGVWRIRPEDVRAFMSGGAA